MLAYLGEGGWQFLYGFGVGPSLSWAGVGPSFSWVEVGPCFSWVGVGQAPTQKRDGLAQPKRREGGGQQPSQMERKGRARNDPEGREGLVVAQSRCPCGRLHGSVVPDKFLLVSLNLVTCGIRGIQRVGCGMVWKSVSRNLTRHELRLSAHPRVPMRHISTTAVCIEPKRQMHTIHP